MTNLRCKKIACSILFGCVHVCHVRYPTALYLRFLVLNCHTASTRIKLRISVGAALPLCEVVILRGVFSIHEDNDNDPRAVPMIIMQTAT